MGAKEGFIQFKRETTSHPDPKRSGVGTTRKDMSRLLHEKAESSACSMHELWLPFCHSGMPQLVKQFRNSMCGYNQSWKKQSPYSKHQLISRSLQEEFVLAPCESKLCIGDQQRSKCYRKLIEKNYSERAIATWFDQSQNPAP